MRIITGQAKGRHLKAPPGLSTRPTTDMVRGAIFSILNSLAQNWERVLDLYAGSGALGIEALSQGAEHADFVEQNARCCNIIKKNLQTTELADRAKVYCTSVHKFLTLPQDNYDIILMDPPYADPDIFAILHQITLWQGTGKNTTIMIQYSRRISLAPVYNKFKEIKSRRYGDTCISFYQIGDEA